jgi:hypothetical protein
LNEEIEDEKSSRKMDHGQLAREEDVNECFGSPHAERRKDRTGKPRKYGSS